MLPRLAQIAEEMLGIKLTPLQLRMFHTYSEELQAWNEKVNLTAITEPEAIEVRHFADSLTTLMVMRPRTPGLRVIDVGTGAGFPGIPLKIVCPAIELTLVEATGKKVDFLQHIVETLKLGPVTLVNERVETIGQMPEHREQYDWALARAVASMNTLMEYLLPLVKVGGHALAMKGESGPQETSEAQEAIRLLGGRLVQLTPVELPTVAETRYLVDVEKIAQTPPKYPRRPGMPNKRPL
ncbi:MAG TPA: 16S rRNA (guanine(527)-N(7))-methyltransferase RsmG [Aggregatilineales bacterium]|nr:16S rRNA (guanine(527)-N(7))-methyltransferase RsmG [Chloroflexota bacterium]HOA24054.1 16S rRNA (guanine(527)-N(7))-methyltransferase RsmG [Aggregatilineales bacterium]HPV07968.1 16S rRNA (guanine(527)-N(7))-methyltransferase RsmG [Aggregatilineales bacterium]HQA68538.1 16S rRNA (guanine(527)-N(7))-methyltransferase RsmG [Aggregatilineales bacterium]HQE17966.1 16S rRNA (guanine(527)-N(7))-methyltransferase RsmG [Aggregatilineales bacterium]